MRDISADNKRLINILRGIHSKITDKELTDIIDIANKYEAYIAELEMENLRLTHKITSKWDYSTGFQRELQLLEIFDKKNHTQSVKKLLEIMREYYDDRKITNTY
jgi:hypothetical protein